MQLAIENQLLENPARFAALERDNSRFQQFAYDTHPKAYKDAGIHYLDISDLANIATTPDVGDLLTVDGLKQMGLVLPDILDVQGTRASRGLSKGLNDFANPRNHAL